jgi:hydrogenase maturation protease
MSKKHTERRKPRILVAGLGNELLGDDGVGVHAARLFSRQTFPQGVVVAEVGTAVLEALHLIVWADVIIAIDAMKANGPPGTIYEGRCCDVAEAVRKVSLHELDFMAVLRFIPHGKSSPEIMILGVEPETIDYSLSLSEPVEAALPGLIARVQQLIEGAAILHCDTGEQFGAE